MRQFFYQNQGLHRIEPKISADLAVKIFWGHTVISYDTKALGQRRIVGHHHARIAESAEVLGWIETRRTGQPDSTCAPYPVASGIPRADGLSRIFNCRQIPVRGNLDNRKHVGTETEEVYRDYCTNPLSIIRFKPRRRRYTTLHQKFLKSRGR